MFSGRCLKFSFRSWYGLFIRSFPNCVNSIFTMFLFAIPSEVMNFLYSKENISFSSLCILLFWLLVVFVYVEMRLWLMPIVPFFE